MIQIYTDGVLAYDSRLEEYDLQGLKITRGLNKGGTAEIIMPPFHPAYSSYIGYRTIVEIYRDGRLRFRGRALYPIDDYYNQRTVICEGELCFFQDALVRPYLYQDDPAVIFAALVQAYNDQVESFKQFKLGDVTVTDPNNYIRLESESAETVLASMNKLLERCGGYIVFTTDPADGKRVVHWLESVGRHSGQVVEAGENLFDFSRSGANTDLATVLLPYGAKDEATGQRVTIASVNDGKDYIADDTAVAIRGTIMRSVTWDDVTDPNNLLQKARQYLNESKLVVTSLTLTALDLSYIDKTVDSYEVGDHIRVLSKAHKLDEEFQLTEQTEDLMNPGNSYINLGKELRTLTRMDVAGDDKSLSEMQKFSAAIKKDFDLNVKQSVDKALEGTVEELYSVIEQQVGSIKMEVSGSLGSKAQITLTAEGGQPNTAELDLSEVRKAFADDTSAVVISGGTVTFNSNTLIINSTNLKVSEDGTITATNAVLSGTATTENGEYKSELSGGRLRFAYGGTEMGGIASGYMGGDSSVRGVALRLEQEAKYIGFSKLDAEGDGYDLTYCINYGANPGGRTERHVFHGNAYFGNNMIVNGMMNVNNSFAAKGHIGLNGPYSVKFLNSAGDYINGLGISTDDKLSVGSEGYDLFVYGSNVCLGHASEGLVQIRGAESNVLSPFTFGNTATFNGQATFNGITFYNNFAYFVNNSYFLANTIISNNTGMKGQSASGSDTIWVAAVNSSNEVVLGDSDYTTYIQGGTITLGTGSSVITVRSNLGVAGAVTLGNNYGVLVKNTSGSGCNVLNINTSNQVNVGHLDYPMYLRGTHVTVNTGNFTVYQGSVVLSNGYGIQGKDTSGNPYYILSVTTANQVGVGASSLPLYLRGSGVYLASSGATVTSDRRKKNSIEELGDAYEALLDKITPVRFKFNDGTSGRYHAGFIAQEVQEALEAAGLTTQDFGGFVDVNKDGEELGLIYSEFIALLLNKIKRQEKRIAALEAVQIGGTAR